MKSHPNNVLNEEPFNLLDNNNINNKEYKDIGQVVPDKPPYKEIIDYLNAKAGKTYRWQIKTTQSHINARFTERYTLEDFKKVIDLKVAEWKGGKMEQYLRPETLFGSKFEGYLNQQGKEEANGRSNGTQTGESAEDFYFRKYGVRIDSGRIKDTGGPFG